MKTVEVKIALAVDPTGAWGAIGWSGDDGEPNLRGCMSDAIDMVGENEARYVVTATVPVPPAPTEHPIEGKCEDFK